MSPTQQALPSRFFCVHGHFYQPPRENPWLEMVETQDSAAPYHDWNERITAQCYGPNGAARILNDRGEIVRITNNYARISFNFGATLLSWLADCAPGAYRSILEADKESQARFSGHGSALAQVFNHVIMPLASTRDKRIQISWGIADFEHRFGRKPEGMWLAETACDSETLELLAEAGIRFTILAPHQCAAVRPLAPAQGEPPAWRATPDASVDTREPYLARLANGRTIALFFYDGPRSRAIAFERLLDSGEGYASRMAAGFKDHGDGHPQLVHVATDGESYGHHHRFGEMGLAYALHFLEQQGLATLTNYGEFLERFPPRFEAKLAENTSWSCAHGVERWRSDCGCSGGKPGFNQRWRAPLRRALDELRDSLRTRVAERAAPLFRDFDLAVLDYIDVMLDRKALPRLLSTHAAHTLAPGERRVALKLLEIERQAQLMYTSCGWFFDDISGIETVQIIAYAARVLQLAIELWGEDGEALEQRFMDTLAQAESNVASEGTGRDIYIKRARGLRVTMEQLAAHYAISSIFTHYGDSVDLFRFHIRRLQHELTTSGRGRLINGIAHLRSELTEDEATMVYSVLHFGDQNIAAVVQRVEPEHLSQTEEHERFLAETRRAVVSADLPAVIRLFDRRFGTQGYSIRALFGDEQRRVVRMLLANTVSEVENRLLHLYRDHSTLIQFVSETEAPRPLALSVAAQFAVNVILRRALEASPLQLAEVSSALSKAKSDAVELEATNLAFVVSTRMTRAMAALRHAPESLPALEEAVAVARAVQLLPFEVDLGHAQNLWYFAWKEARKRGASFADEALFFELGRLLSIAPAQLTAEEGV